MLLDQGPNINSQRQTLLEVQANQVLKGPFLQVDYSTITQSSTLESMVRLVDLQLLEEEAILTMLKMKPQVVKAIAT